MEYFEPTLIDNNYKFYEFVNGGYLQNSMYATYAIKTTWSKELKLIDFIIDKDSMMTLFQKEKPIKKGEIELLDVKCKWNLHFHYNRAIRAKNRHLKYLKIYLGLEKLPELDKPEEYICSGYNYYGKLRICNVGKTKKGELRVSDLPYRHASHIKSTKAKLKLVELYNTQLDELSKLRKKLFEKG